VKIPAIDRPGVFFPLFSLLLLVLGALGCWVFTGQVTFYPNGPAPGTPADPTARYLTDIVWNRILVLGTLAILIERALEILLTTWRSETARQKELEVEHARAELEQHASAAGPYSRSLWARQFASLQPLEQDLESYRGQTRRYSMWIGLVLGCLLASLGVGLFRDMISNLGQLHGLQKFLIVVVDIILTGGLIAGGSDLFHKLIEVYGAFTSRARSVIQPDRPARGAAETPAPKVEPAATSGAAPTGPVTPPSDSGFRLYTDLK
jgi:hypothetical protein